MDKENNSLSVEDKINKLQNGPPVILIRHGKSVANVEYQKVRDATDKKAQELIWTFDKSIRDSDLAELGVEQAEGTQEIMNKVNVHSVLLSPLRRAMLTAYHIFKTHPDFEKIKFVVVPNLRESMNTSSDIPMSVQNLKEEFGNLFPNLDLDLFDAYETPELYFVEDMDEDRREEIMQKLAQNPDFEKSKLSPSFDPCDDILSLIKSHFPEKFELKWSAFDRVQKVKTFIKDYIAKHDISADSEEKAKIVLVTHYVYCYMHTGFWEKEYLRDEPLPHPDKFVSMDNCQIESDPVFEQYTS